MTSKDTLREALPSTDTLRAVMLSVLLIVSLPAGFAALGGLTDSGVATANGHVSVIESFSGGTVNNGTISSGASDNFAVSSSKDAGDDGYSGHWTQSSASSGFIDYSSSDISDPSKLEYSVYIVSKGGYFEFNLETDQQSAEVIQVREDQVSGSTPTNEWARVTWNLDHSAGSYDMTVESPDGSTTHFSDSGSFDTSLNIDSFSFGTNSDTDEDVYFDQVKLYDNPTLSGTVTDENGNAVSGASILIDGTDTGVTTDSNGDYSVTYGETEVQDDANITASSTLDSSSQLADLPWGGQSNVDFTVAAGDIGGRVVACKATDLHCENPSPLANATVEITGLNHTEVESYFDDVNSASEAEQKADELLKDAREWNIDEFEELSSDTIRENLESLDGDYLAVHRGGAWGPNSLDGRGLSWISDIGPLSGTGDLEAPTTTIPADEPVAISLWDSSASNAILPEDVVDESLPGQTTAGTIQIEQLGPDGESMGTTTADTQPTVQVSQPGKPGISKKHETFTTQLSEGYYRISSDQAANEMYIRVGDADIQDVFPGYWRDVEDEAGSLTQKAQTLRDLENAGVLETKTVQADEAGVWSATLPSNVQTVGVTAFKGPQDLLDPANLNDTGLQAQLMQLREEGLSTLEQGVSRLDEPGIETMDDVFNSSDVSISDVKDQLTDSELDGSLLDQAIYAPKEPIETDVPARIDVETRRVSAGAFIDPGFYDGLRDSQLEDFLDENLESLLNELGIPLDEIENLEDLEETLTQLMEDREAMVGEIEDMKALIEDLEQKLETQSLEDLDLEQLLEEYETDISVEGLEELAQAIEDLGDLFPGDGGDESNQELLERIAALETVIEELRETVDNGDDTGEIENGVFNGEFHFPGEIESDSVTVWAVWETPVLQPYANTPDDKLPGPRPPSPVRDRTVVPEEYWSISSTANPFDDGESVIINEFPIPDDRPLADIRVDAVVDGEPKRSEGGAVNPAFDGELPGLNAIDVSTLRPATDDRVRVTVQADESRYDSITNITAYGPDGNPANTTLDRINDDAFVDMNGSGAHWIEVTYQSTSGHNFSHAFQLLASQNPGTPAPTVRVDRAAQGPIALAGDGVESAEIEEAEGTNTARIEAQVPGDTDISELHVQSGGQLGADIFDVDVVSGQDGVAIQQHVSVIIHESVDEETLLWRNGEAMSQASGVNGEYNGEDGVIFTYTDENGNLDLELNRSPGLVDRAQHWINLRVQGLPVLTVIPALGLFVGLLRRRYL